MITEEENGKMRRAAVLGDTETVRTLLEAGVPVDAPCGKMYTALHHAAWYGRTDTLRLLLEWGASTERENNVGATPLFYAVFRNHAEAVRVLLAAGAFPDQRDDGDNSPLHASATNTEIGQLLLDSGANVAVTNALNMTVLASALIEGDAATARFWAERHAPLYVPSDTMLSGILRLRLRNDLEKAAVIREYTPDVAPELLPGIQQRGRRADE